MADSQLMLELFLLHIRGGCSLTVLLKRTATSYFELPNWRSGYFCNGLCNSAKNRRTSGIIPLNACKILNIAISEENVSTESRF